LEATVAGEDVVSGDYFAAAAASALFVVVDDKSVFENRVEVGGAAFALYLQELHWSRRVLASALFVAFVVAFFVSFLVSFVESVSVACSSGFFGFV